MKRRWVQIASLVSRTSGFFPLTSLGLTLGAVALLGLKFLAIDAMDRVVFVVAYGALGLLFFSTIFVVIASFVVARVVGLQSKNLIQRSDLFEVLLATSTFSKTGFHIPSLLWLPLLRVRGRWLDPPAESRDSGEEAVAPSRRGLYERILRHLTVEDVFGLSRISFSIEQRVRVRVRPHLGNLQAAPIWSSLSGGGDVPHPFGSPDGDRVELRRYVPGDPARFIHWKIFSRTRRLMVRTPERALTKSSRTVAYLIAGVSDEATAALAYFALENRLFDGDWTFRADGSSVSTKNRTEAQTQVLRSALHPGGVGFRAYLEQSDRGGPSSLLVFAPPVEGLWIDRVVPLLRGRKALVLIGVDGVCRTEHPSLLLRILARNAPRQGKKVAVVARVVRRLRSVGAQVHVFDRRTGRTVDGLSADARVSFASRHAEDAA
ncbi:MAG: DUF58 domain-containing protein [Myxococcota bacterium]